MESNFNNNIMHGIWHNGSFTQDYELIEFIRWKCEMTQQPKQILNLLFNKQNTKRSVHFNKTKWLASPHVAQHTYVFN